MSHETPRKTKSNRIKKPVTRASRELVVASVLVTFAFAAAFFWTYAQWNERTRPAADASRAPQWSIHAPAALGAAPFVRIQDTSFWTARSNGILTSASHVATQEASAVMKSEEVKSRVTLAPSSIASFHHATLSVVSGFALVTGPVRVALANGERRISSQETVLIANLSQGPRPVNEVVPYLEPRPGSKHDLQTSGHVDFSWPKSLASVQAALEFSRDPSFTTVLFTHPAGGSPHARVDFSDRSPGAWFVRLRETERILAYTVFNLVESETPDQLRRLGRRWFTWRDRGLASLYRVEFSETEAFQKIHSSFQVRNRELDLIQVRPGRHFVRVTAISNAEKEFTSRPISIEVQEKSEILRASLELNDPELKLHARGWKILLTPEETSRVRDGYVILRDSELRGVKVANEIFKDLAPKDYDAKTEILKTVVFELSRDEAFTNPERVRPDSRGELLPPALPLGILYARLRRLESDGTLGAFGASSRLTTWLAAPVPRKTKTLAQDGVELKWDLNTAVAGFELRVSPDRDFKTETTHVIHTHADFRRIAFDSLKDFFWTVTAVNDLGQPISLTSPIQEVHEIKPITEKKARSLSTNPKNSARVPAALTPSIPVLKSPLDEAVIVGGSTAKKYGKLSWDFTSPRPDGMTFEIQIATDGDFVNIIEKAKTPRRDFTLQGDLPEGALFWRVRKTKSKEWSESRKFELVYE